MADSAVTTVQTGARQVTRRVSLTAQPAQVFDLLADPHRHPELQDHVDSHEVRGQPPAGVAAPAGAQVAVGAGADRAGRHPGHGDLQLQHLEVSLRESLEEVEMPETPKIDNDYTAEFARPPRNGDDLLQLPFTDEQRAVLRRGLAEWSGPARPSRQMINALGYRDDADMFQQLSVLIKTLAAREAMTRLDCTKMLLATEIALASSVAGAAGDWQEDSGFNIIESFEILRSIQDMFPTRDQAFIGDAP